MREAERREDEIFAVPGSTAHGDGIVSGLDKSTIKLSISSTLELFLLFGRRFHFLLIDDLRVTKKTLNLFLNVTNTSIYDIE